MPVLKTPSLPQRKDTRILLALFTGGFLLLSCLLSAVLAHAAPKTVITATLADTDKMTLLVEGINLPEGGVYVGRAGGGVQKLEILDSSPTSIEARLLSTEPGTYIVALVVDRERIWTSTVTVGAAGPEGPAGPRGPAGPAGVSGYSYNSFANFSSVLPGRQENVLAVCPDDKKIISAGWQEIGAYGDLVSAGSYPSSDFTWNALIKNTGSVSRAYSFYYICARVSP
jgi:hypothetical protein